MLGMSLVELMVATAVGLIGITMIMQVYSVAEARKRTTTGTSDAQIAGNIALFSIERDIRDAGFGMVTNSGNMLGCDTHFHDDLRPGGNQDSSFVMAPAIITVGGGGGSDTLKLAFGNAANVMEGSSFAAAAGTGADFPLKNAAGFQVGATVVAYDPAAAYCSFAEITGFLPASVNTVQHTSATAYSYIDKTGATINATSRYNKGGGLGQAYGTTALLYSFGRNPVVKTYLVAGDKLITQTAIPYVAAQDTTAADGVTAGADGLSDAEIAAGVVQLKAMYGKDTNGDRIVDTWDTVTPANAAGWMQVRAVKIAVLARSGLFEKTAVTPNAPTWKDPGTGAAINFVMANLADGTDWHNYRYRVYETTVPMRNMIWSNDP